MKVVVDRNWSHHGLDVVRLENEYLIADFLPQLGGKLHRLIDKAADRDVLWHSPRVKPHVAPLSANFDDHWSGGMDDCFPTGGPSVNEYGDELPYLGEIWTLGLDVEVHKSGPLTAEVTLWGHTPITPACFEKTVRLNAGARGIEIDYRIGNTGHRPFSFLWGVHPCLSIEPGFRFDAPARAARVAETDEGWVGELGSSYEWPHFRREQTGDTDMRIAPDPDANSFGLHFLTELSDGWVAATDPRARRGFGLVFDLKVFKAIWFWMVYGGWRGYYHANLEAWTGVPDTLAAARQEGTASVLEAGAELRTTVKALLYEGVSSVAQITPEGNVKEEL